MVLYTFKKKYKDGKTPTGKQLYINKSMYMIECDVCKKEHYRDKGHYKKMKENVLFDKDYCNNCWIFVLYHDHNFVFCYECFNRGIRFIRHSLILAKFVVVI